MNDRTPDAPPRSPPDASTANRATEDTRLDQPRGGAGLGETQALLPATLRPRHAEPSPAEGRREPADPGASAASRAPLVGHIRLEGVLGTGGMGRVYRGFDELLERPVAVKTLRHRHRLDTHVRARLRREARVLSKLNHPRICQLYDLVQSGDRDFLVLELVEGENLRAWLRAAPSARQRLDVAEQIAEALAAAHQQGIVHRDLKPENVLVRADGSVKVLDFGIARVASEAADLDAAAGASPGDASPGDASPGDASPGAIDPLHTVDGQVIGTAPFLSPEQARGEPVGPASDLYSFGLILQELWTGEPTLPHDLSFADALARARAGEIATVRGLSGQRRELVVRLRAADPLARPSAGEALRALRRLRSAPRRRLLAAAAAALVLGVVAGTLKYTLDLRRERERASQARAQAESLVSFMLEDLDRGLAPLGRLDLIEQVARKSLAYFEALPPELLADAGAQPAIALRNAATVLRSRGDLDAAVASLERALAIDRRLLAARPGDLEARDAVADDLHRIARVLEERGDSEPAAERLREARALLEEHLRHDPAAVDVRRALAELALSDGELCRNQGDIACTARHYEEAGTLLAADVAGLPAGEQATTRAAQVEQLYAWALFDTFDRKDARAAERRLEQAIALLDELLASEPRPEWRYRLATLWGQGLCTLRAETHRNAAVTACARAREILDQLVAEDPTNGRWAFAGLWEHIRGGNLAYAGNELETALAEYQRATVLGERLTRQAPMVIDWQHGLAAALASAAAVHEELGDLGRARAAIERAHEVYLEVTRRAPERIRPREDLADSLVELARIQHASGDATAARTNLAAAEALLDELARAAASAPATRATIGRVAVGVALAWRRLGNADREGVLLDRAIAELGALRTAGLAEAADLELELHALLLRERVADADRLLPLLADSGWTAADGDPEVVALARRRGLLP